MNQAALLYSTITIIFCEKILPIFLSNNRTLLNKKENEVAAAQMFFDHFENRLATNYICNACRKNTNPSKALRCNCIKLALGHYEIRPT